jgi:hypothetical protein
MNRDEGDREIERGRIGRAGIAVQLNVVADDALRCSTTEYCSYYQVQPSQRYCVRRSV